jgi:hypothetical protein
MQSCAFIWGKINIIKAYTGGSDLAIVLGERWLVVQKPEWSIAYWRDCLYVISDREVKMEIPVHLA